jgi:serine/threonine protein kinase
MTTDDVTLNNFNNRIFKCYQFSGLIQNQEQILGLTNEYSILRLAKEEELFYLMRLDRFYLSRDHVALSMEKFQMDFRDYLRNHRDYRYLGRILIDVSKGLRELHAIGYVHRDLKPENIVIDLKPLTVRIIDFNRSYPRRQTTVGTQRGTPGYFPDARNLEDGSILWDVWAFCAIVLECDMETDEYLRVATERGSL